jgi:hypothetical protein
MAQEDHPLQAWQALGIQALLRQQGDIQGPGRELQRR